MRDTRPTLCLDFDGVIHAYSRGWNGGALYDELVPGTPEALRQLDKRYRLTVCTARGNTQDVEDYLRGYQLHTIRGVSNVKPAAVRYVDDRGLKFDGDWAPVLRELLA